MFDNHIVDNLILFINSYIPGQFRFYLIFFFFLDLQTIFFIFDIFFLVRTKLKKKLRAAVLSYIIFTSFNFFLNSSQNERR